MSSRIEWAVADMVDCAAVDAVAETALQRFRRVDILVNTAGSNCPQSVESIVDEDWDRIIPKSEA